LAHADRGILSMVFAEAQAVAEISKAEGRLNNHPVGAFTLQ
jgi:hypothetical protein